MKYVAGLSEPDLATEWCRPHTTGGDPAQREAKPPARSAWYIQVCTTSPCLCNGADKVVNAFLEHTGCKELGITSADGKYTVIEVECLGACGFSTPVQINADTIENVTPDKVPVILAGLK